MNNTNFSLTDYIVNNCDIVDVIKHFINLQKKGNNWWGLCPFHGDKNPSLSVSPTKKIFKCFVCNVKGNVISFVKKMKNDNFIDAIKEIMKICNIDDPKVVASIGRVQQKILPLQNIHNLNKEAAFIYHRTLFNKEGKECLNYLLERGIDEKTIDKYQLGFAPESQDRKYLFSLLTNENNILGETRDKSLIFTPAKLIESGLVILNNDDKYNDFFWNRLIIPIQDENGMFVGFSGRSLRKADKMKYINTKTTEFFKKEEILFNFCNFDKSLYNSIFVVEGYMDVFAMVKIGRENTIASMGTAFTEKQVNLIKKYKNIEQIILCFDNDEPGRNATSEAAEKFLKAGFDVYVVKPYDSRFKDIDELLKSQGIEKSFEITNQQISYIEFEAVRRLYNLKDNKEIVYQTNQIIKMINSFAYNELHINNHLKVISKLSNIPIENLKNLIKPIRQSNQFVDNNQRTEFNKTQFVKKKRNEYLYEDLKNNFFNDDSNFKISLDEHQKAKYKKNEVQLIKTIIVNSVIRELFFEWIASINFNDDPIKRILKCIISWLKKMMINELEINYQSLIYIIDKQESVSYKDEVLSFLNESKKEFENQKITYTEILNQGIQLTKDIFNRLIKSKNNYLLLSEIDKESQKEKSRLLKNQLESFEAEIEVLFTNNIDDN